MRLKENICRAILDTRAIVSGPWSRIQLPDAPFHHHNVPSSEDWAKEMLDIWKVNWLYSVSRELELESSIKQARPCAFVLVWIHSKPCYLCQTGSSDDSGGGGIGNRFKLLGTDNVACVFVFHYLSTVQINLFKTSPSYTASESQCFRFVV